MQRAVIVLVVRDKEMAVEIDVPDSCSIRADLKIQVGFGLRYKGEAPNREELEPVIQAAYNAIETALTQAPVDMVLNCPKCGTQHIDTPFSQS